ncbi:MAG TPA: class I SAM-dependent methyltransferase [Anaerolineaceae bacterium]|nr:class I SAM-dependent methyltransferase [Anaerolineaceae bacterium]HQH84189.1 class I SAM-dependent methyltransferase [Anaerolineaceae bacterium]
MSDSISVIPGNCVNCGGCHFKKLHPGRDRLHRLPGEFSVDECLSCGLITVHPRLSLEESSKYYPSDYVSYPVAVEDEKSRFRRWDRWYGREKRCRAIIKRVGSPGRVLDIGCATGIFLSGMRQHGWECYGIEPSEFAANYARRRFDLEVFQGYLENAPFPLGHFDLITLWDVLEHLPDPVTSLAQIRQLLKPDGWLVLSLPNASAWERRWFGEYWVGWDVPRHYNTFEPRTIKHLLEKCGFSIREIASFTGRHGAMLISLEFLLADKKISPRAKTIILRLMRSIVARAFTLPFYGLADALNRSSVMNVFAQITPDDGHLGKV